jgi:hypothetical protein
MTIKPIAQRHPAVPSFDLQPCETFLFRCLRRRNRQRATANIHCLGLFARLYKCDGTACAITTSRSVVLRVVRRPSRLEPMRTSSEFYTLIALHVNVFVDLLDYISSVYHLGLQHVSDELVDELERDDPLLKKRGPRSRALSNVSIILVFGIRRYSVRT